MPRLRQPDPADLERRELHLTVFVCVALAIMAVGSAVLMYPVVFSHQGVPPDRNLRIAFFGFCGLCVLLTAYVWDTQRTILRLRRQMDLNRKQTMAALQQASEELLKNIPKLSSFQDHLPMEFRRTTATEQALSVLIVGVQFPSHASSASVRAPILGDVAKAISRRLRDQDSLYVLGPTCFGAILSGMETSAARGVASRVSEGLLDAAGLSARFAYKIDVVNYPQQVSSAHEIYEAVRALMPADASVHELAAEAIA